jgi:hypothetical protein
VQTEAEHATACNRSRVETTGGFAEVAGKQVKEICILQLFFDLQSSPSFSVPFEFYNGPGKLQ